ncbi:hypothetical protein EJB05_19410, partial [Eragrostis curvula]
MSKRQSSDERGDRAAKRPAPQRKQHLYLLLDDWERGYSVRKLDVESFDTVADSDRSPTPFTEPPIARIEAPHVSPAIPAFDADTLALTICPWPSCRADYVIPLFVSVGGKLFLFLEDLTEFLGDPPPPYDDQSKAPWFWTTIKAPLPFYNAQVACYAVHPDGRTLFVSAGGGTFSFDAELEAWVGLCGDRDNAGRLCSCDVPPPVDAEFTRPPRSRKVCKDKLFRKESELHRGAKLVYMGDGKFCLVESMFHKDEQHLRRRVLRMTTFGLKYDKAGELQITRQQGHA